MTAWALFCHDFDLSKGINILSEKCPVVLDHYIYLIERFSRDVFDITLSSPLASHDRATRFKESEQEIFHLDHYYSNGNGKLLDILLTQGKKTIAPNSISDIKEIAVYLLKLAVNANLPQLKILEIKKIVESISNFGISSHIDAIPNLYKILEESNIKPNDTKEKVIEEINTDITNLKSILIKAVIPAINLELAFFNGVDKQVKLLISALEDENNRHTSTFDSFLSTVIPIVKKQELDNIAEIIKQQEIKQEILISINQLH